MIDEIIGKACTGCTSCVNSCPLKCIHMEADKEGFSYPKVNVNCNKCGKCISKCPILNEDYKNKNDKKPEVFASWSRNETIRYNSTSGGIFTELSNFILKNNGYVVGAKYNDDFIVEHTIIHKSKEIYKLRQSKYLQSNMGNIYGRIQNLLEYDKTVLFCGTPCQVSGLSTYLGKEYPNLIKCDFICRGVISPMVYKKYLDMLENRYNQSIEKVVFKNKSRGWNGFCTLIKFKDDSEYIEDRNNDLYMQGYLKYNMYLRPCCHECKYKEIPRISDITLGDFWRIGETREYLDDNKGTSVVLLNSAKGENLFKEILSNIVYEKCTIEEVLKGNVCLLESAPKGKYRERFFKELIDKPFDEAFFNTINK